MTNIKLLIRFYILSFLLTLKSDVHFTLTAHPNSDRSHFKSLIATCSKWYHIGKFRSRMMVTSHLGQLYFPLRICMYDEQFKKPLNNKGFVWLAPVSLRRGKLERTTASSTAGLGGKNLKRGSTLGRRVKGARAQGSFRMGEGFTPEQPGVFPDRLPGGLRAGRPVPASADSVCRMPHSDKKAAAKKATRTEPILEMGTQGMSHQCWLNNCISHLSGGPKGKPKRQIVFF